MFREYTVGSMFAGIGGIDLAFVQAGKKSDQSDVKIVWTNEIDSKACETYSRNKKLFNLDSGVDLIPKDIYDVKIKEIPNIDILTAGFPCQAFSIAGHRLGFEDKRGILFYQVEKIIKKKKPSVVFLENVKNLRTHDEGRTFEKIHRVLKEQNYDVWDKVLNTMEYGGIPQNRERIYIVAFRKDQYPNAVEKLSDCPLEKKEKKNIRNVVCFNDSEGEIPEKYYYDKNHKYYEKLNECMSNPDSVYQWRRVYIRENKSGVCPTLTANMGGGGHNVPIIRMDDGRIRKLTPKECFLLQGFPDDYILPSLSDSSLYKQAGNSVSVPVIQLIAENILSVLNTYDNCSNYTVCER